MVPEIKIENLPEEMGEETALTNRDDGTLCSKVLGSTRTDLGSTRTGSTRTDLGSIHTDSKRFLEASVDRSGYVEGETKPEENEETKEKEEKPKSETEEREFDKNPTVLYALVQKKLWKEAAARAKSYPREARAFICRREKDGKVRWRLLPIHAAIVFKAPEEVVEALLSAFPKGSQEKDDQGMLPLHLGFRNGASEEIVNLLLMAFPESVDSPDRKGRVPLTLAKAAASPRREIYIDALEKGPSHYAVTALSCARDRIEAEQKKVFESKLAQSRQFHECALSEMEASAEKKQQELKEKLAEKEKELTKIHENSQVLVDHVTSLEAQMNTRSDTERFLATKIAKLEQSVREHEAAKLEKESQYQIAMAENVRELEQAKKLKEEKEIAFENEKFKFNTEKEILLATHAETQKKLASTQDDLKQVREEFATMSEEWSLKEKRMTDKMERVELEWASAQANCAIFDAQLKQRMENDAMMSSTVSTLTTRLADSATDAMKFRNNIKELEEQRTTLEKTVQALTKRLGKVTDSMEDVRKHQMSILDDAIVQEESMAKSMENHAMMVSQALDHEQELSEAKAEIMALVERAFDSLNEFRREQLTTTSTQGKLLGSMNGCRQNILSSVQSVTTNVMNVLATDLDLGSVPDELAQMKSLEETVDAVVPPKQSLSVVCDVVERDEDEGGRTDMEETVEVVVSPKKSLSVVCDVVQKDENEEGRTDMDEVQSEETMNDTRVTAE